MDSLHLFAIPSWLPETLLPELWSIIFHWKWRLEMKDILKQLPENSHTENIRNNKSGMMYLSGDHWLKFRNHPGVWYGWYYNIKVTAKCGIELLNWRDVPIHRYGMATFPICCNTRTLHHHITMNLGLKCSRKLDYKAMMKLLRNI